MILSPEALEIEPHMRKHKRATAQELVKASGRPRQFVDRGLGGLLSAGIVEIDNATNQYVIIRNA
jgi:predicted transcriptional regulator